MPLMHGDSRAAVSANIRAEEAAGKPQAQAVAIALREAREATLKRVAADARKHHGLRLTGKVEGWPAKLDAAGAVELAEQIRNVLARGPVGKKGRRTVDHSEREERKRALDGDKKMLAKYKADLKTLKRGGRVENLSIAGAENAISGLEAAIMNKKAALGAPRRVTVNKEERDAKRRADRRAAEDKADDQRRKLKACEASISEHERTIENAKAEIKKLRADCKRHKGEIKKLEAKVKRLS